VICGVFLGGASSRMGEPKALLQVASGETLLTRACRVAREAGLTPVLVGPRAEIVAALAPDEDSLARIADAAVERGPLAGLVALLRFARAGHAVALACDMPHVDRETLTALWAARVASPVVAPRRDGRWEPLVAAYAVEHVLPIAEARLAAGELGLQGLLEACGAREVVVAARALEDWDTLADVARDGGRSAQNR